MKICVRCGQYLNDQQLFCHNCGMKVNNEQIQNEVIDNAITEIKEPEPIQSIEINQEEKPDKTPLNNWVKVILSVLVAVVPIIGSIIGIITGIFHIS